MKTKSKVLIASLALVVVLAVAIVAVFAAVTNTASDSATFTISYTADREVVAEVEVTNGDTTKTVKIANGAIVVDDSDDYDDDLDFSEIELVGSDNRSTTFTVKVTNLLTTASRSDITCKLTAGFGTKASPAAQDPDNVTLEVDSDMLRANVTKIAYSTANAGAGQPNSVTYTVTYSIVENEDVEAFGGFINVDLSVGD